MSKSLVEVLIDSNITVLTSTGGRYKAHCPFHEGDNEPSFTIYPNQTYYCFGCQVWGDAVKFLVEYKGFSAQEALEYVGLDYKLPKAEKKQTIKMQNSSKTWKFLYEITQQYHDYLLGSQGPQDYIRRRGLTEDTIRTFKLGYTDGRVLNLKFAEEYKLASEIGILSKSGYETLGHRITIPNLIDTNLCDFIIGRTVINDSIRYLGARMPKPLLGFHAVRYSPAILLVEGQFDWLTLRQWGYPAACIGGTSLKDDTILPLTQKIIIIVPDYDNTVGESAAKSLQARFDTPRYGGSYILDYKELRRGTEKLDVSTLAERGEEESFQQIVKEKLPWLHTLSKRILTE